MLISFIYKFWMKLFYNILNTKNLLFINNCCIFNAGKALASFRNSINWGSIISIISSISLSLISVSISHTGRNLIDGWTAIIQGFKLLSIINSNVIHWRYLSDVNTLFQWHPRATNVVAICFQYDSHNIFSMFVIFG